MANFTGLCLLKAEDEDWYFTRRWQQLDWRAQEWIPALEDVTKSVVGTASVICDSVSSLTSQLVSLLYFCVDKVREFVFLYIYQLFLELCFICKESFVLISVNIWSIFTSLFNNKEESSSSSSSSSSYYSTSDFSQDEIASFTKGDQFEGLSGDLAELKRRVHQMEMELKREREERVAGSNVDQLKLEHHQKQLQVMNFVVRYNGISVLTQQARTFQSHLPLVDKSENMSFCFLEASSQLKSS